MAIMRAMKLRSLGLCLPVLIACGSSNPTIDEPTDAGGGGPDGAMNVPDGGCGKCVPDGGPSDAAPGPDTSGPMPYTTIITIVLENHDYAEIIGSSNAPYINSLTSKGVLLTNYMDSGTHPSLPNYLTMISGDPQYIGVVDLDPTFFPFPKKGVDNLGSQMEKASIKWRAYEENAGGNCVLSATGTYAPKHDPFLYFDEIQNGPSGLCAARNVQYSDFAGDLAAGATKYMFITPDLNDDGHDPSNDPVKGLGQSDKWLSTEVPKILASSAYTSGGILFITWDEAEGRNGDNADQVPMIILSPHLKAPGTPVMTAYSHKSYLATVEDILGLPRASTVTSEPTMKGLFSP